MLVEQLHKELEAKLDAGLIVKVKFKKTFFEEAFMEPGMIAHLISIEEHDFYDGAVEFKLEFSFKGFEDVNFPLMVADYHPTTKTGYDKQYYTAIEAGQYFDIDDVYWHSKKNDIVDYIEVLED